VEREVVVGQPQRLVRLELRLRQSQRKHAQHVSIVTDATATPRTAVRGVAPPSLRPLNEAE
jgi:hypothetical protein